MKVINALSEWAGKTISWLFLALTILVVVDVVQRYVFNNPWYYFDINIQFMGALAVIGGSYCLLYDGHIGVDTLVLRFSPRNQELVKIILFPLLLCTLIPLLIYQWRNTWHSVAIQEEFTTSLGLPAYPYKVILLVGVILLLLQGISNLVRDVKKYRALAGEEGDNR